MAKQRQAAASSGKQRQAAASNGKQRQWHWRQQAAAALLFGGGEQSPLLPPSPLIVFCSGDGREEQPPSLWCFFFPVCYRVKQKWSLCEEQHLRTPLAWSDERSVSGLPAALRQGRPAAAAASRTVRARARARRASIRRRVATPGMLPPAARYRCKGTLWRELMLVRPCESVDRGIRGRLRGWSGLLEASVRKNTNCCGRLFFPRSLLSSP